MKPTIDAVHPVLGSRDVDASVAFYARLGFRLVFQDKPDAPAYAAVRRDRVELHIQWADAAQWPAGVDRPVYRFLVEDVDGLYAEFLRVPDLDLRATWDTAWGTREFHLRDPDGNGLQFYRVRGESAAGGDTDAERLAQIERHFHRVILERARHYRGPEFALPSIATAPRGGEKPAWFPVPGMHGGFAYHLEGEGETLMLVADSWSRVVDGSGQRHHITPAGAVLVDDGFV